MKKYFLLLLLLNYPFLYGQWNWCSNTPQNTGNGWAIDAVGTKFVIFSSGGQLLRSSNGGDTWNEIQFSNQSSPYFGDPIAISVTDTLHYWIGTSTGVIVATTTAGNSWDVQFRDTAQTEFIDYIKMFDVNNGIALCTPKAGLPALFLATTNGGTTWAPRTSSELVNKYSGDVWRRVCFLNPSTGFFWPSPGGSNTALLKTSNSGQSWTPTNYVRYAQILRFYNEDIGLIHESSGKIWRTTDGGANWIEAVPPQTQWGNDIEFDPANPARVWLTDNSNLYYSADTGRTWVVQYSSFSQSIPGRDIVFTDSFHGWILGDGTHLYKTTNAGNVVSVPILIASSNLMSFGIINSYPNPFNPSTMISFNVTTLSTVSLKIYDLVGREVAVVVSEQLSAGRYERNWNATGMPAGIYFCRLQADGYSATKKLVLIK